MGDIWIKTTIKLTWRDGKEEQRIREEETAALTTEQLGQLMQRCNSLKQGRPRSIRPNGDLWLWHMRWLIAFIGRTVQWMHR